MAATWWQVAAHAMLAAADADVAAAFTGTIIDLAQLQASKWSCNHEGSGE